MTTLTDFLLARIAEDEGVARAGEDDWDIPEGVAYTRVGLGSDAIRVHTIDPTRLLAECGAKRRIVSNALTLHEQADEMTDDDPNHASFQGQALAWRVALRILALPYCDHPDWREEWRA